MFKFLASENRSQDHDENMRVIMIESYKHNDEIFFEHGIEEDDFLAAVLYYNLRDDPEVRSIMMRIKQEHAMGGMMGR